jgi:hypothetical protein
VRSRCKPGRGFVSVAVRHAPGLGGTQLTVSGSYALGLGRRHRTHGAPWPAARRRLLGQRRRARSDPCDTPPRSSTAALDCRASRGTCFVTWTATASSEEPMSPWPMPPYASADS